MRMMEHNRYGPADYRLRLLAGDDRRGTPGPKISAGLQL